MTARGLRGDKLPAGKSAAVESAERRSYIQRGRTYGHIACACSRFGQGLREPGERGGRGPRRAIFCPRPMAMANVAHDLPHRPAHRVVVRAHRPHGRPVCRHTPTPSLEIQSESDFSRWLGQGAPPARRRSGLRDCTPPRPGSSPGDLRQPPACHTETSSEPVERTFQHYATRAKRQFRSTRWPSGKRSPLRP